MKIHGPPEAVSARLVREREAQGYDPETVRDGLRLEVDGVTVQADGERLTAMLELVRAWDARANVWPLDANGQPGPPAEALRSLPPLT